MDTNKRKSLEFHIKTDDYFVTLATVLNFVREKTKTQEHENSTDQALQSKIDELMYLQDHYKITPK